MRLRVSRRVVEVQRTLVSSGAASQLTIPHTAAVSVLELLAQPLTEMKLYLHHSSIMRSPHGFRKKGFRLDGGP
jgi:hypothetical protein